ncbi:LPD1 domain-containing protein, partial [Agitococcus lubricus]
QKKQGGYFDEHKIMLGFLSQQQAIDTYQHCFERGWTGLMSVVPCTIEQLKWWLANGDKSRPVTVNRLPYAGLERLDSVSWNDDKLCSHGGKAHNVMYQIRQSDNTHHALEPMLFTDMVQELGSQGFVYENYDALVTEYNKLERKAQQLLTVMQAATTAVKPVRVVVSKPLTKNGVANVIAWFEMDDGQAVGVFFHNPDKNPKKLDPTDEMISYKWVLNKKDITIAVAPEQGKDLNVRTVAKRIMQLVDKNHDRFMKANSAKAELNVKEQDLNAQVAQKQAELSTLEAEIKELEVKKTEKENAIKENQEVKVASIQSWDAVAADQHMKDLIAKQNGDFIAASREYFSVYLQGQSVKTQIGLVYINSRSKNKMLHRIRQTTAQVIPRIPEILTLGNIGERTPLNKERNDTFVAFYQFDKWLDFTEVRIHARIKVGELPNGLLAYYLAAAKNEEASSFDSSWAEEDESSQARSHTQTRLDNIEADDDEEVNIEILEIVSKNQEQPTDLGSDIEQEEEDGFSDDYKDENYRFKDVGYIAGARKELAQSAIMQAKKLGQLVSVTDIDWDALEDDPRIATATIIKKNVFGQVDWEQLKESGMAGNAAYFIKRLYAAVELQPDNDSKEDRQLYVTAIQNLRSTFEACKTLEDVIREVVVLSKLLNTYRNMIRQADGSSVLNYDSQVAHALGKKLKSWVFKTGNNAIYDSRKMKADDWSWLEKTDKPTATKPKKPSFQLEAASHIQRVGGKDVSIQSTEHFKNLFGLKAIQSGNWVLKDKESIEFHIQRAAESMLDMSDVTGIAPDLLGFGGRLGLAFGARGKGGALAHYEPVERMINITKMKGGGSLGHEYFHALDNLMQDLMNQSTSGKAGFFATETPHLLPDSLTKQAFMALSSAMLEGSQVLTETLKLTEKDFATATYNMKPELIERSEVKRNIVAAGDVWNAVLAVDAYFFRHGVRGFRSKTHMEYIKIAAAHYANKEETAVNIPTLDKGSQFFRDALELDEGRRGKYWSKTLEMAARAFSSYLQDKLEQQGRTNDYLAFSTKGGHGRVGEEAYPQGEERERIHAAFDGLFKALKEEQVFEKAIANKTFMDSLFGEDMDRDELLALGYEEE